MDATTKEKLDKLVAEIAKYSGIGDGSRYRHPLIAELHVILAEEQDKASLRMEQQTDRLVKQTDRLVDFTKGLYWFTAALLVLGVIQLIVAFCHP